jgi:hypothetical protein
VVLAGEAEAPAVVEVAVADDCAQGEDGSGAVQGPSCSGDVEPVADEVAEGSLDHPGGDGRQPARPPGPVTAAGAVGRFQIQLAALAGAEVTAVSRRPEAAPELLDHGAARIVATVGDAAGHFELVLDTVGGRTLAAAVGKVAPGGTVVLSRRQRGGTGSDHVIDDLQGGGGHLRP